MFARSVTAEAELTDAVRVARPTAIRGRRSRPCWGLKQTHSDASASRTPNTDPRSRHRRGEQGCSVEPFHRLIMSEAPG